MLRILILCAAPPVALVVGLLAGCGSGLNPAENIQNLLVDSFPSPVRSLEGSIVGGDRVVRNGRLEVGDTADDRPVHSFTAFEMPESRAGRELEAAILRVHHYGAEGMPFEELGDLMIERVDLGESLDTSDWFHDGSSRMYFSGTGVGVVEFDITQLVRDAIDLGVSRLDLRMRFEGHFTRDGVANRLVFAAWFLEQRDLPPNLTVRWRATE